MFVAHRSNPGLIDRFLNDAVDFVIAKRAGRTKNQQPDSALQRSIILLDRPAQSRSWGRWKMNRSNRNTGRQDSPPSGLLILFGTGGGSVTTILSIFSKRMCICQEFARSQRPFVPRQLPTIRR